MRNQLLLLKKASRATLILLLLFVFSNSVDGRENFTSGRWQVTFNKQKGDINIYYEEKTVCNALYASYQWEGKEVTAHDYARHKLSISKTSDSFGKGHMYKVEHTDKEFPKMTQYPLYLSGQRVFPN